MNYWLIKSESRIYAYDDLVKDGRTYWEGVRSYQARNNLKAMKKGDLALYYHSAHERVVVGIVKIVKEAYQDPTTPNVRWVAVDIVPERKFTKPVTLAQIKADERLQGIALLRQRRLSVMPIPQEAFAIIVAMGTTV
ncbi:MAG: EVE domain-containing protein [Cytophagales bacterium]|nr:EVE domain-containing protein [Cytophagales bacterium]